jgi:hypothetical protein
VHLTQAKQSQYHSASGASGLFGSLMQEVRAVGGARQQRQEEKRKESKINMALA